MEEQIWSFSRGGELLEVKRTRSDEGYLLSVNGDGAPRTYFFADLERLDQFQADFEKFLLGTGWLFVAFSPERRGGRERRHFSRLLSDRRRWWTDGVRRPIKHDDEGPRRVRRVRRHPQ